MSSQRKQWSTSDCIRVIIWYHMFIILQWLKRGKQSTTQTLSVPTSCCIAHSKPSKGKDRPIACCRQYAIFLVPSNCSYSTWFLHVVRVSLHLSRVQPGTASTQPKELLNREAQISEPQTDFGYRTLRSYDLLYTLVDNRRCSMLLMW